MAWAGTTTKIDNFDYPIELSTTPQTTFGWTIKDTSAAGAPTYLGTADDGGSVKMTMAANDEAEILTLYNNDVLNFDVAKIKNVWWVAKVAAVDAVTDCFFGVAAAYAADPDDIVTNAWFKIDGSVSTSALVVETDDATNDLDDTATGTTLAAVYKRLLIDFSQGLSDVRFYVDGARVASATTFDMSDLTSGLNVQPYVQIMKASGTGVGAVQLAQFGITYTWSYG